MNTTIINNINNTVKPSDDLYILGDFCFGDTKTTNMFLDKINCKNIYLIKGNHDGFLKDYSNTKVNFKWVKQYYELKYNNYTFIMFHYPILVWNKKHYGSIHLYGHCHISEKGRQIPVDYMKNSFNVNCEFHNYMPINLNDIISLHDPTINNIK